MATFTLTVTNVRRVNGKVYITYSNGDEDEYASLQQALDERDALFAMGQRILKRLVMARYLRVDPTANNPSLIEGHSITFNDNINNMIVVS